MHRFTTHKGTEIACLPAQAGEARAANPVRWLAHLTGQVAYLFRNTGDLPCREREAFSFGERFASNILAKLVRGLDKETAALLVPLEIEALQAFAISNGARPKLASSPVPFLKIPAPLTRNASEVREVLRFLLYLCYNLLIGR